MIAVRNNHCRPKIRRTVGRVARLTGMLVASLAFASCDAERRESQGLPPVAERAPVADSAPRATITELPLDTNLAAAVGVTMRTIEVRHPPSTKLSITKRVYRNGVLDSKLSSRQVHGRSGESGIHYLKLGWLDQDIIIPEHQGKLKIFGSGGTIWIDKPTSGNYGGFIDVPVSGEFSAESQQLAMELAYGAGVPRSSLGLGAAEIREGASVRVTLHVLVEPLSQEEEAELKNSGFGNFNKAYEVTE